MEQLLVTYGLERTIYRISISPYADKFTLKGGIFLYAVFDGDFVRMTTDIDLLAQGISNDVERDWQDFYSSYVSTYLERDINELISVDSLVFAKFMTAVAARTGEMINYANIAGEVGVSEPTIKKWISVLERTGIVYILQPYSASVLTRAIKTPKLYFRDTGLACYLTRWLTAETLKNSAVAGNMFETFVVSEILKSYSNEGKDYSFG